MLYAARDIQILRKSEFRIEVRIGSLTRQLIYVTLATAAGLGAFAVLFGALSKPLPSLYLLLGVPAAILLGTVVLSSRTRLVAEGLTRSLTLETRSGLLLANRVEIPFFQFTHVLLFNDPEGKLSGGFGRDLWGVGLKNPHLEIQALLFCEDEALVRKIAAGIAQASGKRVFETDSSGLVSLSRHPSDRFRKKLQLIEDAEAKAAEISAAVAREKARRKAEEAADEEEELEARREASEDSPIQSGDAD